MSNLSFFVNACFLLTHSKVHCVSSSHALFIISMTQKAVVNVPQGEAAVTTSCTPEQPMATEPTMMFSHHVPEQALNRFSGQRQTVSLVQFTMYNLYIYSTYTCSLFTYHCTEPYNSYRSTRKCTVHSIRMYYCLVCC